LGLLNKFRRDTKKKDLVEEVCDHLSVLFNTKQLFGSWQKGYGMGSYTSGKPRSELIEDMVNDLKYNIETYERRLKLLSIKVIDEKDVFNPRFQISCKIGEKFHSFYIGFKTTVEII